MKKTVDAIGDVCPIPVVKTKKVIEELKAQGYRLFATGEMGIGNTTTSSAVASVLLGQPVETMTGRGAGLSSDGLTRKIQAIKESR